MRRPDTRGCEIAYQCHISILFDKVRYFSHYAQEDRAGAGQTYLPFEPAHEFTLSNLI
jgi:hypothetical protein